MKSLIATIAASLAFALSLPLVAQAQNFASSPYMGWSSWSLQAYNPDHERDHWIKWMTADHIKAQSDAMHRLLGSRGYNYINMDSGWSTGYDGYGRPTLDATRFPLGMADLVSYIHRNHQKLGIYICPGIDGGLYAQNPPILGTPYHIQDICFKPVQPANSWGRDVRIDYSQPGAQAYINSLADQFAAWGIDFIKLDAVAPDADHTDPAVVDNRPDVMALSNAIKRTKRPIWLELSWSLDHDYAPFWEKYANGRRITFDIEDYKTTVTNWANVVKRFDAAALWSGDAGLSKGWNDLDSLDIGNGAVDGLTDDERQTAMTLWAISCAPLYSGDDLTKLDTFGVKLLSNQDVIAVDQQGIPATRVTNGQQQIWKIIEADGTHVVALFNFDDKPKTVTVNWNILGGQYPETMDQFEGGVVYDLYAQKAVGESWGTYTATVPSHGSRLIEIRTIHAHAYGVRNSASNVEYNSTNR